MRFTHILHSLRFTIVLLSCIVAFSIRIFPVVLNESIIHEFDPHFNWRCAQYINEHGLYEFLGWYDNISWYPQGRPVGETAYPGLMYTSAIAKWTLQKFHIYIDIKEVCVFTGPFVASLTTLLAFLFGQLIEDSSLGCLFAAVISTIPGAISRSVSGSYDYECISLFILISCLYTFALALKHGSVVLSFISALFYGYMCLTWGGYVFISNCIPLFVMALIVFGQYSWRLYVTYSIWAIVGTILSVSIPFINEKIVTKPEHFSLIGVFMVVQIWGFFCLVRKSVSKASYSSFVVISTITLPLFVLFVITVGVSTGILGGFSGRLIQMFDPSYASKHVPIIASVAEHQSSPWGSYFMDCGILLVLFPLGIYFILNDGICKRTEVEFLLLIYGLSTLYFASVMIRLVIVFTPAMAMISSLGIQRLLKASYRFRGGGLSTVIQFTLFLLLVFTQISSVFLTFNSSRNSDHITFDVNTIDGPQKSDDYREGYRWLWENTPKNARVMSWWDYGYQITSMSGRGCMADGNTNNFTHIGIIGMTMSSPEIISWKLAKMMGADYMLVIFGGAVGYSGDDINKFMWMPKIAHQTFDNITGEMYETSVYESVVSSSMTKNMTLSMMFRFCYNNFKKYVFGGPVRNGFDLARYAKVPNLDIKLSNFEEAFTSKYWIVRIYKVMDDPLWNRVY